MQYLIGVDIGTTHTKAVVVTDGGEVRGQVRKSYPLLQSSPGSQEQDPLIILAAVINSIQEAVDSIADRDNIAAVSFSSAMHGLLAIDENGKPLTSLYTWADTRSISFAEELKQSGKAKQLYEETGTPIHPMSPLCKIGWLREQEPALVAKAFKFISIKELAWAHFFGEYKIDHSIAAATGLFDIRKKEFSELALSVAGISTEKLSTPVPIEYSRLASDPGFPIKNLPSTCVFIIGASDGALANIGSGTLGKQEAALTIGTSGAIRVIRNKPVQDKHQRLFNYCFDNETYLIGGAINNGGIVLRWFVDNFLKHTEPSMEKIMATAAAVSPGADGLIFLPYVYGERAPIWDAAAKGVFFGIDARHGSAHFLRAVLEGVGYSLRQLVEALEENEIIIDHMHASGGFVESPVWVQIICDILGKKMSLSRAADASAMGAVFLAMKVLKKWPDWKNITSFVSNDEVYFPSDDSKSVYQRNYTVYAGLYDKLKGDFQQQGDFFSPQLVRRGG